MCLVGVCVEPDEKHTSQRLTLARVALRPRERLKLPRMKKGNPSDSKAETGNDIDIDLCARRNLSSLDVICTCLAGSEAGR